MFSIGFSKAGRALGRLVSVRTVAACALAGGLVLAGANMGCHHSDTTAQTENSGKSLYEQLGGKPAVEAVVNDFVAKAASDPAVNFTRKGHPNEWDPTPENVEKLKKHLVQFIGHATGGPEVYEGRDMASVHAGMQISEAEWNASVADLKYALDKNNVPADLQAQLIKIVATTHDSIVGH